MKTVRMILKLTNISKGTITLVNTGNIGTKKPIKLKVGQQVGLVFVDGNWRKA